MTFGDLDLGAEFKVLTWKQGGNNAGDCLAGTWRKIVGTTYNAVKVGSRGRHVAFVGPNVKVRPTGKVGHTNL